MDRVSTLIVGAGLTGLSAAYHLELDGKADYLLIERDHEVGGLSRTETYAGFSFDHSIHILYTRDSYIEDLICNKLLPDNLKKETRESYCYTAGRYTEYPYQANNYGLPTKMIAKNILGLVKAHWGAIADQPPEHFEAWIYQTFGQGIAEHFMIPYNRRQWAWDLRDMDYDWIADRVPRPELATVLRGALWPPEKKYGPNQEFWYPVTGGIEALPRAFLDAISKERIRRNTSLIAIDAFHHQATLSNGSHIFYDQLISTVPVPLLIKMLEENSVPLEIKACAAGLKHNVVHTVNIGLSGTKLGIMKPMHWAYYPEEGPIFHRLSFPHNFSDWMAPLGCCSIQAEISESAMRPLNRTDLVQDTLTGLVQVGLLDKHEVQSVQDGGRVQVSKVVTLDPAYVIYDIKHRENIQRTLDYLKSFDIFSRGRFGEWEYYNMDHAILSGRKAISARRN